MLYKYMSRYQYKPFVSAVYGCQTFYDIFYPDTYPEKYFRFITT